jgi:hypothetical protein
MTKELVEAVLAPRNRRRFEIGLWFVLGTLGVLIYAERFLCTAANFDPEQLWSGIGATTLLDGLAAPIWYSQATTVTGSLVFGVFLFPFYACFGSSCLVLKIVSALMVVGGAVFWTLAVRRAWGLTAAVIFFLWLAVPPPFLEWHLHQSWGGRSESLLFSGLLVWLFAGLGETPPRFLGALGLGLWAGLASFFCFDNLAIVAALAAAAVWRWGRAGLYRLMWPTAFGFAATFSLTLFAVVVPPAVAHYSENLGAGHAAAVWHGVTDLFGRLLPTFAGYRGIVGRWLSAVWFALAALGLAVAGWLGAAPKTPRSPKSALAVFLGFHFLFYVAAYGLSTMKIPALSGSVAWTAWTARYLYTLTPTLLALISLFLASVRGGWKWLLLAPFLAGGFAHLATDGACTREKLAQTYFDLLARRGDNYPIYLENSLPRSWRDETTAVRSVARLPRRWRGKGCRILGKWLGPARALALLADGDALPADARRNVAAGAGAAFLDEALDRGKQRVFIAGKADLLARLRALDSDAAREFVAGMGHGMGGRRAGEAEAARIPGFAEFACSTLAQLTDGECRQSLIRGEAAYWGERSEPVPNGQLMADCASRYEPAADDARRAAAVAAFRSGWADGNAASLAGDFNRIAVGDDFVPELREAFARMGVDLRPTGKPHEYDLVILP